MRSLMSFPGNVRKERVETPASPIDIRDYMDDEKLDRIYDVLVRYAGAPDGHIAPESVRAQFRIHTKAGHYRFRFGGELLDWEGWIVLRRNCFTIPITKDMSRAQEKIANRANEKLGILREEIFPRSFYRSSV